MQTGQRKALLHHLGASISHEQHVETFYVTVNNADQRVMKILQKRRHFAHRPDALVCMRGGITAQFVEPGSAWHPLHNDEGVSRGQACCDDVHAVRMADLKKNEGEIGFGRAPRDVQYAL